MAYSADLSRNPDTWVYYINEMTQAPTYVQDDASLPDQVGTMPWIRKWRTSWTQTVAGCPVEYKIYMETTDADGNTVDVEIEPTLSHPTYGAGFYSDVIEYDVTTIKT